MLIEPRARIRRYLASNVTVTALGRDDHLVARRSSPAATISPEALPDIPFAALEPGS